MGFSVTWDETKPAGLDDLSQGDDRIREFKTQIRERLAVDHHFNSSDDSQTGFHQQLTIINSSSDPAQVANALLLYTKTTGGVRELFSRHESQPLQQLTLNGKLWIAALTMAGLAQGDVLFYDGTVINRLAAGSSGQFLKTLGAGANPAWAASSGQLLSVSVFTSSGTWTRPAGCNQVLVKVVGGGGGGQGGYNGYYTSGGAAGGYSEKFVTSPGATETVTVGAGGSGGAANSSGVDGGASSFGSWATANGGKGGATTPQSGGTASGGHINITGQGNLGYSTNNNGQGNGSDSPMGFGKGGRFVNGGNESSIGYGSGGPGVVNSGSGNAGQGGIVIVYELS